MHNKSTGLVDHYVVTGKPNDVYLAHFTPATLPCAAKRKHRKFYNSFLFYFFEDFFLLRLLQKKISF